MQSAADCLKALTEAGVEFTCIDHAATPTIPVRATQTPPSNTRPLDPDNSAPRASQEMHEELKKAGVADVGRAAKNLVLKHKKTGAVYLLVVRSTLGGDFAKILTKILSSGSGNLRNCDEGTIEELLGSKKGHINPLAVANDTGSKVQLLVDQGFAAAGAECLVHPMENNKSVKMSWEAMNSFFEKHGHPARIVDLENTDAAAPAAAGGKKKPEKKADKKGETKLGLSVRKTEDFPRWYQEANIPTRSVPLAIRLHPLCSASNIWVGCLLCGALIR